MNKACALSIFFCGDLNLVVCKIQVINVSETIEFPQRKNLENS